MSSRRGRLPGRGFELGDDESARAGRSHASDEQPTVQAIVTGAQPTIGVSRSSAARLLEFLFDLQTRVADISQSSLRIFLEAATQQPMEGRRQIARQSRPIGFAFNDSGDEIRTGLSDECPSSGERFVEHTAERPDVCAFVDWSSARLLWTHVGQGTQNRPFTRLAYRGRLRQIMSSRLAY